MQVIRGTLVEKIRAIINTGNGVPVDSRQSTVDWELLKVNFNGLIRKLALPEFFGETFEAE